jgi:hypothetical protein
MRQDRKELLEKIGFVWNVEAHQWHLHYKKLVEFKQQNGHCCVPTKYQEDAFLGNWVCWQRQLHSKKRIEPNRNVLLDEIGFVWKADTVAARSSNTDVSYR